MPDRLKVLRAAVPVNGCTRWRMCRQWRRRTKNIFAWVSVFPIKMPIVRCTVLISVGPLWNRVPQSHQAMVWGMLGCNYW